MSEVRTILLTHIPTPKVWSLWFRYGTCALYYWILLIVSVVAHNIAGYTTLFATCVGLLTNARRSEVFAACAAYAAVLIVFVSGNIGSGGAA